MTKSKSVFAELRNDLDKRHKEGDVESYYYDGYSDAIDACEEAVLKLIDDRITPEKLHELYLEAVKQLSPESYNKNAEKPFTELTEDQKFIDRYIAKRLREELKTNGK